MLIVESLDLNRMIFKEHILLIPYRIYQALDIARDECILSDSNFDLEFYI